MASSHHEIQRFPPAQNLRVVNHPSPAQLPPAQLPPDQLPPDQLPSDQLPPDQVVLDALSVNLSRACTINIIEDPVSIYTDGSCVDKHGGYGVVVVKEGDNDNHSGPTPFDPATNNSSELYAIHHALDLIESQSLKNVIIYL